MIMIDNIKVSDSPSLNVGTLVSDTMPITGYVTLRLLDGDGNEIMRSGSNQVVFIGRHRLSRVICGDVGVSATEKTLNTLKVSNGAATAANYLDPNAVSATDTGLFTAAGAYSTALSVPTFNTVSGTSNPTATYAATLTSVTVNKLINEAGIFFGSTGPMFAHYSFPTIDLRNSTTNSLEITWQFTF